MAKKIVVGIIIILTLLTRLWGIDSVPPHLSNDEISIAYDAYSLSVNGRDGDNKTWPILFKSLGAYKAPLYMYLLVPLEKIFGNNEVVARIPSLLAGILTVGIIGLIGYELSGNMWMGIAASGVLAVCPAHIMTSRLVLEANLAMMFLALGIWLILKNKWWGGISSLATSVYTYYTEWLLVPMLGLLALKIFIKNLRLAIIITIFAVILITPLAVSYTKNSGPEARSKSEILWKDAILETELKKLGPIESGVRIGKAFLENYMGYFNPEYLFFNGLKLLPKENAYQPGIFLWPLLIPMIIGLKNTGKFIKGKKQKFFWGWFLISPMVASLTHGGPNLYRNLNSLLPLSIIIAVGLIAMSRIGRNIVCSVSVLALTMFMIKYLVIYPTEMAESFQGFKPIAKFFEHIRDNVNNVFIDYRYGNYASGRGQEYIGVPHLYFGYFGLWDPQIIQNRIYTKDGVTYGKYTVKQIDWNNIKIAKDDYFVVSISNEPTVKVIDKVLLVKVFNDASGKKAFEVWKGI